MQKITPSKLLFILLLALLLLTLSMPIQPSVSAHAAKADVEYWAVIVGVADYPGDNDLDYTDDDAYDVRDVLLASSNWEADHITMLIDSGATKLNISNAITDMGTSGDSNDVFFFFFSGHGTTVTDWDLDEGDDQDEALCQYDFQPPGPGPITDDELGDWLSVLPGAPVLVAIDTCFSGGMIKAGQGQSRGLLSTGVPAAGDGFARDLDGVINGVVLTACDDDESSYEFSALQNGLFTYYFVEGLAGAADSEGNSDGSVSMEEVFDYLYPLVVAYKIPPPEHPQEYDNWLDEAVLAILVTPTPSPTVTTTDATSVEETAAILNGMISDDGGEACQYRFEYDTDSGEPYAHHTDWTGNVITGQSFGEAISDLAKGTKYYFRAQAKNNDGTGSGAELTFLTKPDGPTGFSATPAGTTQIDLSWTKGEGADRTKIQRKEDSYPAHINDGTEVYFATGTSKSDTGLSPGKTYYYRAWSYVQGSEQWSDNYAEVTATTMTGILYEVTISANPKVVSITVDETTYLPEQLPVSFSWDTSTQHDCVVPLEESGEEGTQYVFTSWSDGHPSSFRTISEGGNYTAYYQTQHYLTVTSEHGSPYGEGWYDEGNATQIEATEIISEDDTRYIFLDWIVDGINQTENPVSITMDAPHTAVANYKIQYYLLVDYEYGDDPSGEGWYDEGNTTSIGSAKETIIDDDNAGTRYVFLNWIVDGVDQNENPISISMDAPQTAVADYKTQHYLTVESPYGDEPSGEDWYDEGTTATTGTAEQTVTDANTDYTQYVFLNWAVDGDDQSGNPISITMDAPHTAVTDYKTQHYLTVNSEYGDPEGQDWYDEDSTATVSVTSPVGGIVRKVFSGWSGDSTATTSSTTILLDEPKSVTANWRDDYLYLYLIIGGIVVVVGGGLALVISTTRGRKPRRYGGTF